MRYTTENLCIARYTLAVDRRTKPRDERQADFIPCIAFGKGAEFAKNYLQKGTKLIVEGHIQTGSYTNKDGQRIYTTDVAVESQEFAESKAVGEQQTRPEATAPAEAYTYDSDGWGHIPESADDEGLPFN